MAERDRITDRVERHEPARDDDLALLERGEAPGPEEGELDDGDTVAEDSGAGSFLDRFVPARPRGG